MVGKIVALEVTMTAKRSIPMMNDDVIRIAQLRQTLAALDTLDLPCKKRVRESLEAEIEYRRQNIPVAIRVADANQRAFDQRYG